MASDNVDIGVGLFLTTFPAQLIAKAQVLDYTLPAAVAEIVETSHQLTTTLKTKIAADLGDGGQLELTVHHHQDYDYFAEVGTSGTTIVTLPSGATLTFTAVYESYTPQSTPLNGKMVADVVLTVSGDVTVAAA